MGIGDLLFSLKDGALDSLIRINMKTLMKVRKNDVGAIIGARVLVMHFNSLPSSSEGEYHLGVIQ